MKIKLHTLKPGLRTLGTSTKELTPGSWRTGKSTTERGYGYRWQKARETFLRAHPLCVMCKELDGIVAIATIVDHKIPHRGDEALFWDRGNWQSLCASHHSSDKQMAERSGRVRARIGADGWPVG